MSPQVILTLLKSPQNHSTIWNTHRHKKANSAVFRYSMCEVTANCCSESNFDIHRDGAQPKRITMRKRDTTQDSNHAKPTQGQKKTCARFCRFFVARGLRRCRVWSPHTSTLVINCESHGQSYVHMWRWYFYTHYSDSSSAGFATLIVVHFDRQNDVLQWFDDM